MVFQRSRIQRQTGISKVQKFFRVLPDKKHDWTFEIKERKVLLDERHDQTFGIKVR
ncbi:hypothetical protein RclHR1_08330001, partial [Rhizophagus clarus]